MKSSGFILVKYDDRNVAREKKIVEDDFFRQLPGTGYVNVGPIRWLQTCNSDSTWLDLLGTHKLILVSQRR